MSSGLHREMRFEEALAGVLRSSTRECRSSCLRCASVRIVSTTGIGPDLAGKAAGGRKLIAVVYADMVGYSRLIGLDDAGTLRRLRTLRRALIDPAIREHGGRVVQTGGDFAAGRVRQHRWRGALRGQGAAAGAGV